MPAANFYEFGVFRADPQRRHLLLDGEIRPLTPKVFEILLVLIEHRGQVLTRDELMNAVWPDTVARCFATKAEKLTLEPSEGS